MDDLNPSPLGVFISAFLCSAFAGLAALLRKDGIPLTPVSVLSSLLNSGLLGLALSLLWYTTYKENVYTLVGVCVLAGLGGMTTVEMALKALRSGGLALKVDKDGGVELPEGKDDA